MNESTINKKVYISGMHSGQNPSSGVGIARSLKKAFPKLTIVGVDHWQGASGLHDKSIDEVLILPQWSQIDRSLQIDQLRQLLDAGHIWISAHDVEVHWLAQNFGAHENLLVPSGAALSATAKPHVEAFTALDFKVPESISAFLSDNEVHSFLRDHAWQCWLKGPYHDAKRITSWDGFERARENMQKEWKTSQLFVQHHKIGNEESICFTAYHGELLEAVHMQKRILTPEGKTWAGRVTNLSPEFQARLKSILRQLEWSGGGEIEYTRDPDGNNWIIECNPRFPAWIYGSALVKANLPARLLARALGRSFVESATGYAGFTRIVQEVPAREFVGLPMPPDPSLMSWSVNGQKGKSGPMQSQLIPPLRETMELRTIEPADYEDPVPPAKIKPNMSPDYWAEAGAMVVDFQGETPQRMPMLKWTASRFEKLQESLKPTRAFSPELRIGYSLKTSPTIHHIENAQKAGFLMECISQLEVHRALSLGAQPAQVILNGPGKFWPLTREPVTGLHMVFADSVEEFHRLIERPEMALCLGARISLPKLNSRFGIPVDEFDNFKQLLAGISKMKTRNKLGFHFHMPSWLIGVNRWKTAFESILTWCQAVEQLTGVVVRHLDFGGGFYPGDLVSLNLRWVQESINQALPNVEAVYFEPGRSLTQEGEILISRVLSVRKKTSRHPAEIVVDASVAELPLAQTYPHRLFYRTADAMKIQNFESGDSRILGRICMESDILASGIDVPENLKIGDLVVFGDAGAYERSMSYEFGRG